MAGKQAALVDFSVNWYDKHYSPEKPFRKAELDAADVLQACQDPSARHHKRLDMTWNQQYVQRFGRLAGLEVPDRRAPQAAWFSSLKAAPQGSFSSTWPPTAATLNSNSRAIPPLLMPEQRPSTSGGDEKLPSVGSRSAGNSSQGSRASASGLNRASTAPSIGMGPILSPMDIQKSFKLCAPTSNARYGWIAPPKHLQYQPKPTMHAEEVKLKEHMLHNKIQYDPSIRFINSGGHPMMPK